MRRMKNIYWLVAFLLLGIYSHAQSSMAVFQIINQNTKVPITDAEVLINKKKIAAADTNGIVKINTNTINNNELVFEAEHFTSKKIKANATDSITIVLLKPSTNAIEEIIVVSSTRNNQRIENSPLKIEVLGREEMEEENLIKPGNIASILGDVSGVQIQQTSNTSGNANVRIQGLGGQYTQILKDGMPIYEGFSGGFGIMSIPPLDLKQVELIKGSASTLYGGGAIGGLINIISRRPTSKQEAVLTINASTLNEKNANFYLSKKYKTIGYTVFGGYTNQAAVDVNKDGFSDVTKLSNITFHPRLFIYPNNKTMISIGNNLIIEKRLGGDMDYILQKNNSSFYEGNNTIRNTTDAIVTSTIKNNWKLEAKASYSIFNKTVNSQMHQFHGLQNNIFSEVSVQIPLPKNNIVIGTNFINQQFKILPSNPVLFTNFGNTTFGVFAQSTWQVNKKSILETGIRNDITKNFGTFILPRVAYIYHIHDAWAARAGIGFGYKTPNILNNQIRDIAIQNILPLPTNITAEKSIGYNAEINYKHNWKKNELFINHAFFYTTIASPIIIQTDANNNAIFTNANKSISSKGFDTYTKLTLAEYELYGGFTYTIAERNYLATNKWMTYTPKYRAAFTAVREWEEHGFRIGLEASYNGFQYRDDFSKTPAYWFIAALVQQKFGKHIHAVLNCENLLDYRQSRTENLYTGSKSNPQFQTLWAPIDGRVINLAIKYSL